MKKLFLLFGLLIVFTTQAQEERLKLTVDGVDYYIKSNIASPDSYDDYDYFTLDSNGLPTVLSVTATQQLIYNNYINEQIVIPENPNDDVYVKRTELVETGTNLYDKDDSLNDNSGWLNGSNVVQSHAVATHSKYFKIIPGEDYWYLGAYGASTNFIITDKYFTQTRAISGTVDGTFTAASNEEYVRFSVRNKDDFMFAKGSTQGTYESYYFRIVESSLNNPFKDVTIVGFGDSITWLAGGWTTTFIDLVKPKAFYNEAISGQKFAWRAGTIETITPPTDGHDNNVAWNSYKKWMATSPDSPDAIFIFELTNDYSQGSTIGTYIDAYSDTVDNISQLTACNAYRKLVHEILTDHPNTQIFYITPVQSKTGGRTYDGLQGGRNELVKISQRMGVKVIDVFYESGVSVEFENVSAAGRHTYDGVHLTSSVSAAGSEASAEKGAVIVGAYIKNEFEKLFIFNN